jgi:uncharacterized membrane protein YtjA (UPF0391 family)
MLKFALLCLIIALIAGGLGFSGVAGAFIGIAKFVFGLFLVLFVILLVAAFVIGKAIF